MDIAALGLCMKKLRLSEESISSAQGGGSGREEI